MFPRRSHTLLVVFHLTSTPFLSSPCDSPGSRSFNLFSLFDPSFRKTRWVGHKSQSLCRPKISNRQVCRCSRTEFLQPFDNSCIRYLDNLNNFLYRTSIVVHLS